jgi:hypothetical protein
LVCLHLLYIFVDYTNKDITVGYWNKNRQVSKKDVIKAGLTGQLLEPRTSKHFIPHRPYGLKILLSNLI